MRYKITKYLLLFLIVLNQNLQAQTIHKNSIDFHYLENLIKIGIDSLRAEKNLHPLAHDSILYLAAVDHAKYLLKTGEFSHNQKNSIKRTPHKRVLFYNGKHNMSGENIAKIYIFRPLFNYQNKTINISDYKLAAIEFVEGWKHSKGHYKNIMTPEFNSTGVAVSYNKKTDEVFAVQVFGRSNNIALNPEFNKYLRLSDTSDKIQYKPHKRHAYNIKYPAKEKDIVLYNRIRKRVFGNSRYYSSNNKLYLRLKNYNAADYFFKKRKDGLLMEYVPFYLYRHKDLYYNYPSRKNNECIFNGFVSEPTYKKEIIGNKRKVKRKSRPFTVNLGEIPNSNSDSLNEMNVLILKRNRIVDVIYFQHSCGEMINYLPDIDYIDLPFNVHETGYTPKAEKDSLFLKVNFERNKTEVDPAIINQIKNYLSRKNYKPLYAYITAYASVEGPANINTELYKKRAENISGIFKSYGSENFPVKILTKENWRLFNNQIRNTKYNFLTEKDTSYVKKFLQLEQPLVDLDKKLYAQRYLSVFIVSEEIITNENLNSYAINEYHKIVKPYLNSNNRYYNKSITESTKSKLENIQHFLFERYLKNELDFSMIESLPVNIDSKKLNNKNRYNQLEINILLLKLNHTNLTGSEKYEIYKKLNSYNNIDPNHKINYYIWELNKKLNSNDTVETKFLESLNNLIKKIKAPIDKKIIDELRLYYHFKTLQLAYSKNPFDDFSDYKNSFRYIFDYYNSVTDPQTALNISKFFELFKSYTYASEILEPFINNDVNDPEILKQYVRLLFNNIEDTNNTEYYDLLFWAHKKLKKSDWCGLFTDACRINFQILDYVPLYQFFCNECVD